MIDVLLGIVVSLGIYGEKKVETLDDFYEAVLSRQSKADTATLCIRPTQVQTRQSLSMGKRSEHKLSPPDQDTILNLYLLGEGKSVFFSGVMQPHFKTGQHEMDSVCFFSLFYFVYVCAFYGIVIFLRVRMNTKLYDGVESGIWDKLEEGKEDDQSIQHKNFKNLKPFSSLVFL